MTETSDRNSKTEDKRYRELTEVWKSNFKQPNQSNKNGKIMSGF